VYYEALQELARARQARLIEDARAERLAHATRRRHRRRWRLHATLQELLLDGRRRVTQLRDACGLP
jgi:hypothetical protein